MKNPVILTRAHIQSGFVHLFHKQGHRIHMDTPQLAHTCHRDFHRDHQHRHSLIHTSWVSGKGQQIAKQKEKNVRCIPEESEKIIFYQDRSFRNST